MVSKNTRNDHGISIPAEWSLPKFPLAKQVQIKTVLPHATRIQTGEIGGMEYIKPDSLWVTRHGVNPGWYYSIHIDTADPWHAIDPIICVNESDINELTASF